MSVTHPEPIPERLRETWALIERWRRDDESWVDACERLLYAAMVREHYTQDQIAKFMSCSRGEVHRRMQRYSLRPSGKANALRRGAKRGANAKERAEWNDATASR